MDLYFGFYGSGKLFGQNVQVIHKGTQYSPQIWRLIISLALGILAHLLRMLSWNLNALLSRVMAYHNHHLTFGDWTPRVYISS